MRVLFATLLGAMLLAGCADREARTTRRPSTGSTTTPSNTETPRTTTDRNLATQGNNGGPAFANQATPGNAGGAAAETTTQTTTETRTERSASRPVIEDPGANLDKDNTAQNKRDANGELTKTPTDQQENKKDIEITGAIRKRVTDTEASVNAQNVKIITQDGKVTLRGPVKNDTEKQMIERIAKEVAGDGNVENLLEVESNE
jgi:osmotically-inducible protein OsmY